MLAPLRYGKWVGKWVGAGLLQQGSKAARLRCRRGVGTLSCVCAVHWVLRQPFVARARVGAVCACRSTHGFCWRRLAVACLRAGAATSAAVRSCSSQCACLTIHHHSSSATATFVITLFSRGKNASGMGCSQGFIVRWSSRGGARRAHARMGQLVREACRLPPCGANVTHARHLGLSALTIHV